MSRLRIALLMSVLASCTDDKSEDDDTGAAQDRVLAAQLQRHVDAIHAAGVVGVLGRVANERTQLEAASGVTELGGNEPLAPDSRVRIGSNTKTFVAVVVLQLAEEGVLDLGDPIDRWLPGLVSGQGYDGTQITIRQLLQHTSGIYNYSKDLLRTYSPDALPVLRFKHYEPTELVAVALRQPPRFAPGTSWSYSNTNYVLAGMIIKAATGHDWRAEVVARIIEPLGLSATSAPLDEAELPSPHPHGYQFLSEADPPLDATEMNHSIADAAGAMISTTSDLVTFWRALQGGKLLGAAMMAEMHATVPVNDEGDIRPGSRYGLGIISYPISCGGDSWNHEGDTFGFVNKNSVNDDGTVAAVMLQTTNPGGPVADAESFQLLDEAMCAGR